MTENITINIEDIELSLDKMKENAERTSTKIPNDPMSPNNLLLTDKILQINADMQRILDQYKALFTENIQSTRKSAQDMVRADEMIGQEISCGRK